MQMNLMNEGDGLIHYNKITGIEPGTNILTTNSGAVLSVCEKYRYLLWRVWDTEKPVVLFVALNPSTANHNTDDPTIRRMMGFARDWGMGGILVANLFAYRATDPSELSFIHKHRETDPIQAPGDSNDLVLKYAASITKKTVFCWGKAGSFIGRDIEVEKIIMGAYCFDYTIDGSPRHPLYLSKMQPLVPYERKRYYL